MPNPQPTSLASTDRDARLWTLLLLSSLAYFFSVHQADNDLWGHLFAGREILARGGVPRVDAYSYTVAGGAWFNHEWLTHVLFAELYGAAGSAGLLLYKMVAALAAFGLTFAGIRRRSAQPWIWGSVGLLTIAVLARGFAIRPQVFSYAAIALVLDLLDRYQHGSLRLLWLLAPLFVLWANVHGGFVLGLAIVAGFTGWQLLMGFPLLRPTPDAHRPSSLRTLLAVFASCLGAAMLTPYGSKLLGYLWDELSRSHPITEWQPASPWQSEHSAFFLMFAVFVASLLLGWRRGAVNGHALTLPQAQGERGNTYDDTRSTAREGRAAVEQPHWRDDGWRVVLSLGVGLFAIRHQRHIPVFALCAAVPLTAQLEALAHRLDERRYQLLSDAALTMVRAGLVLLALFQLTLTGLRLWRDGLQVTFDPSEYPVAAVAALKAGAAHGNLAVPLDWGAYVLWHLAPQIKPSIDGRFATVFPESVVEDNFAFYRGDDRWRRLIDNYPTEAVLAPRDWQLPIEHAPGWHKVYEDSVATLFVREDHIGDFGIRLGNSTTPTGFFP
ncbi:MAG: hypothetical protein HY270_24130 [Deltaproteobacteria bacterium]|nr:hypothetical protein [Deltaproteobacteria bacterium]